MKALIISEDKTFIDTFDSYFSQKGFDTIIYKWLLKALDNIEEIRPDCVILSSSEYPRHWKTLVQFVKSGIGGDKIACFLYEPNPLSAKDDSKAQALGISGYIKSFAPEDLSVLDKYLEENFESKQIKNEINTSENIIKEDSELNTITVDNIISENSELVSGSGNFIFTHPLTGEFVTGNYFDKQSNKITAVIDNFDSLSFTPSMKIETFSTLSDELCNTVSAEVKEIINLNNKNFVIFELEK